MNAISSQRFRDWEIVEEKMEQLKADGAEFVIVPVVNAFMDDMYIVIDKHHTMTAAHQLGLEIRFEEVEDDISYYKDIEEQNSENILAAHKYDDAYYFINEDAEDLIGMDVF